MSDLELLEAIRQKGYDVYVQANYDERGFRCCVFRPDAAKAVFGVTALTVLASLEEAMRKLDELR